MTASSFVLQERPLRSTKATIDRRIADVWP
jgi:hypothetical protein